MSQFSGTRRPPTFFPSRLLIKLTISTFLLSITTLFTIPTVNAQDQSESFMDLSLDDLLNVDITSVSKKTEKRSEAAAAVYVITNEDIRRSTATTIPDLLRVVPGVNVAQIDAHTWSVTVRGLGGEFATKLLVLVDGRTVYNPFFSSVYWDSIDLVLEDIDRIEIIRGPGGTLWGANAVNGVINIVTKTAQDTQGGLLSVSAGSQINGSLSLRYGGSINENQFYRVYAKGYRISDNDDDFMGNDANDKSDQGRAGARYDIELNDEETLTIQADYFSTSADANFYIPNAIPLPNLQFPGHTLTPSSKNHRGFNSLARWTNQISDTSDIQIQAYIDTFHYESLIIDERRTTYDIEFQHRFTLGERNEIVWGLGYRHSQDSFDMTQLATLDPEKETTDLFSVFIQDEFRVTDNLKVIAGTKLEHNDYTAFEFQPTLRTLWSPTQNQTLWASVSRAVRTPNRAENDIRLLYQPLPGFTELPAPGIVLGTHNFESVELIAYDIGCRHVFGKKVMADLAAFYNDYEKDRNFGPVANPTVPPFNVPLQLNNDLSYVTRGFELTLDYRPINRWLLRGNYAFIDSSDEGIGLNAAEQQFALANQLNFTSNVYADTTLRFVDVVDELFIEDYLTLDARIGWKPTDSIELSLNARNLLDSEQFEYIETIGNRATTEIERSIFGQIRLEL